jgi:ergothioneine biosynthesis protein EgtB
MPPPTPSLTLGHRYRAVRQTTVDLCAGLSPEDAVIQSMPDASPAKWHLAHTAWFFETFILAREPGFQPFNPAFRYLFNSYYEAVGARHERSARGLLTRPSLDEVLRYRRHVDEKMLAVLEASADPPIASVTTLGLHHEQQHQELILTDIKHAFWSNPLRPSYGAAPVPPGPGLDAGGGGAGRQAPARPQWLPFAGGLVSIGHEGPGPDGEPFAFDNESPRHQVFLTPYALASRPVSNREYLAFVDDGGYRRPELWLSDGWQAAAAAAWQAPFYWEKRDDAWWSMTLAGMRPVDLDQPVCHISFYEADAYARWASARLPTEAEWETVAAGARVEGNLLGTGGAPHPRAISGSGPAAEAGFFGDVWEWTQSPYTSYPGYRPAAGALGEYNGKFMCNQMVLRGGSCATPLTHIRASYRNFFPPATRWQFSGLRLARDA